MRVAAVTGIRSMLGQHVARRLEAIGIPVISIGRSKSDIIFMDLGKQQACSHQNIEIDWLFHCAASFASDIPEGIEENLSVNTNGAAAICHLADRTGAKKIIYAGTLSSDERCGPHQISSYGLSKKFAENIFTWWAHNREVQFCSLRLAQLYDTQGLCIAHQPWFGRVIAYASRGLDLRLPPSLGSLRNFLHVEDAADMLISAARENVSGILNATHPVSMTMSDLARIAFDIFDSGGSPLIAEEKVPFRSFNFPDSADTFRKLKAPEPRPIQQGIKEIESAGTYTKFGPLDVV